MGLSTWEKSDIVFDKATQIGANEMLKYLMEKYADLTQVKTNEINEDLVRYIDALPDSDIAAIKYHFGNDVTNNIFTEWKMGYEENEPTSLMSLNGLTQMYVSELMTVDGFGQYAAFVDLFTNFAEEMTGDSEYISSQYELVGGIGKYPTEANELMLVVDEDQLITDLLLGQLGFYTQNEFLNISNGENILVNDVYKKLLPEGINEQDFYSALYELCGVFSLGECIFETVCVNNEKKLIKDIQFA
jgi:hypothetical protein